MKRILQTFALPLLLLLAASPALAADSWYFKTPATIKVTYTGTNGLNTTKSFKFKNIFTGVHVDGNNNICISLVDADKVPDSNPLSFNNFGTHVNFNVLGRRLSPKNATQGVGSWDTGLNNFSSIWLNRIRFSDHSTVEVVVFRGSTYFQNIDKDATISMFSPDVNASYATIKYTVNKRKTLPSLWKMTATIDCHAAGLLTVGADKHPATITFTISGTSYGHDNPGWNPTSFARPFTGTTSVAP